MWGKIWEATKGVLVAAATATLTVSDAMGVQHNTIAKTVAGVVLSLFAAEVAWKNRQGARASQQSLAIQTEVHPEEAATVLPPAKGGKTEILGETDTPNRVR